MSRRKELLINTFIIFIGRASTQLVTLIMLPIYTSYIVSKEYGIVDLILTYISLIVPVVTLEIDMAAFRFLIDSRNDEDKKKDVLTNIIITLFIITLVFIFIYLFVIIFIKIKFTFYVLLAIIFNMFSSVMIQVARGLGKNKEYSISCIICGLFTVILNIFTIIYLKLGGLGILISMIFSNLIMTIYLVIKTKVLFYIDRNRYNWLEVKKLLKYSTPLIPNLISWWIVSVSDRTLISMFLDVSSSGIYSVANKFPSLYYGIYNVFHLSWTEQASIHYNDNDRDKYLSNVINNGFIIFGLLCSICIVGISLFFNFFIKKDYILSYNHIPILMLAMLCNSAIGLISAIYVAAKNSKELAKTSIMAAIINILFNIIFIRKIGLYAASLSTFIAYFLMLIFRIYDIKKYVIISYDIKKIISILAIIMLSCLGYYSNNIYFNVLIMIFVIMYTLLLFRKDICLLLKRKRNAK